MWLNLWACRCSGTLWTREISLNLWVCVKYMLINLSSDYHYLMGLRRDTIPSPQSTGRCKLVSHLQIR
jgi:hypothetical protein